MRLYTAGLTVLLLAGLTIGIGHVDPAAAPTLGFVRIVTVESGVVPPGTQLFIRTNEVVSTNRAFRSAIYGGQVAEGVQDQNGNVVIPSMSPVELTVKKVGFLGPGGVGMWEFVLDIRAITVKDVRYEVETAEGRNRGAGFEPQGALAVAAEGPTHHVRTSGRRINVPAGTVLKFQTAEPIRLRDYQAS
jgi:hypothetical protein